MVFAGRLGMLPQVRSIASEGQCLEVVHCHLSGGRRPAVLSPCPLRLPARLQLG